MNLAVDKFLKSIYYISICITDTYRFSGYFKEETNVIYISIHTSELKEEIQC